MDPTQHLTPYFYAGVDPQPSLRLQPCNSTVRGHKTPKVPWQPRKAPEEAAPACHAGPDTATVFQVWPPLLSSFPTTGPPPDTPTKITTFQTDDTKHLNGAATEPVPKKPRKPKEPKTKTKPRPGTAVEGGYPASEVPGLELAAPTTAPKKEKAEKETKTKMGEKENLSIGTKQAQHADLDIDVDDKPRTVKVPKTSKSRTTTLTKKKQGQEAGETKWKVVKSVPTTAIPPPPTFFEAEDRPLKRPRVWCDSIEELTSAIPPLANITNGISWIHAPTPVVFLENLDEIGVECVRAGGKDVELVMTRDFTCLLSEMDDAGLWDESARVGPPKIVKNSGEEPRKTSQGRTKTKATSSTARKDDTQAQAPVKTEARLGPEPSLVPIPIPFVLGGGGSQPEVNLKEGEDKEGIREMAVWDGKPFSNSRVPESWGFFRDEAERGRASADSSLAMGLTVGGGVLGMHLPTTSMAAARLRGGQGRKRRRGEEGGGDVSASMSGEEEEDQGGPQFLSTPSRRIKLEGRDLDLGESCTGKKSRKTKSKTRMDPSSGAGLPPRDVQAEPQSQLSSQAQVKAGSTATRPGGKIKRPRDAGSSEGDEARPKGKKGVNDKKSRKSPPPLLQPVGSRVPLTNMTTTTTTITIRDRRDKEGLTKVPPEASQPVSRVNVNRQRLEEKLKEEALEKAKAKKKEKEKEKEEKAKQEKAKQMVEEKRKTKEEKIRNALKNLKFSRTKNEDGGGLDSVVAESVVKEEMNVEVVPPLSEAGDSGVNLQSPVSQPDLESRGVDVGEGTGDDDAFRNFEEVPILMLDQDSIEPSVERQYVDGAGGNVEGKDDRSKTAAQGMWGRPYRGAGAWSCEVPVTDVHQVGGEEEREDDVLKFKKKAPMPPPSPDLVPEPVPDLEPDPEKEGPSEGTRERWSPESHSRNEHDVKAAAQGNWSRHYRDGAGSWGCGMTSTVPQDWHHPPTSARGGHSPSHYERTPMTHHFRGDTRPRYKPGDRGGGFRGRGDMGRKHNRDVHTFPNGYQIKHERSDGQDSCWAPQNAPAPFHPVSRRGQSQQPGMSGSWPVPMPRHQSAYSYQGVPTEPRAMASAHPPSHLVTFGATTSQAQQTTNKRDLAGKDGEDGVGGAECAVTKAGLGNQVEVVRRLEGEEIEPSFPMEADARVPELDQMESSVPLLKLSGGPKAGDPRQVSWPKATQILPPPSVPDDAGTSSSHPIWTGVVKDEENFLDVRTRVLEVPPATNGLSQPMLNGGVNKEGEIVSAQVPKRPPPEVDVLVRAYTSGFPVILVATRSVIHKKWGNLRVPEECEYVYLGCFSVQGVQERRVEATVVPGQKKGSTKVVEAGDVASPTMTGRVEWRFRMRWGASGEEWKEAEEAGQDTVQPWWSSDRKGKGKAQDDDLGDEWSAGRFRKARKEHLKYRFNVNELCWSALPIRTEVVGRRGSGGEEKSEGKGEDGNGWGWWGWGLADESFPSGWHCADCGKVNYQVMFRHRKCSSSFCKGKPPSKTYAFGVEHLRDPQQNSAMSHPYNSYPTSAVEASVVEWEDGMQTFCYAAKGREDIVVKHVFTGNTPVLQKDANKFLKEIQLEVPMERPRRNTSPYFSYTAGPLGVPWDRGPQCLMEVKEALLDFAGGYGETDLTINHLSLLSWVTAGSKKGNTVFSGIKHSIVIMFLGCEAVLTLVPQSGLDDPGGGGGPVVSMDDALALEHGVAPTRNEEEDIDMDGDEVPYAAAVSTSTRRTLTKPAKRGIVVTMVHGDIVLLSGDKFEYSIKRDGTGILLIGECR